MPLDPVFGHIKFGFLPFARSASLADRLGRCSRLSAPVMDGAGLLRPGWSGCFWHLSQTRRRSRHHTLSLPLAICGCPALDRSQDGRLDHDVPLRHRKAEIPVCILQAVDVENAVLNGSHCFNIVGICAIQPGPLQRNPEGQGISHSDWPG